MNHRTKRKIGVCAILLAGAFVLLQTVRAQQQPQAPAGAAPTAKVQLPTHPPAPGDGKSLVVQLCDGETSLTVAGMKPGDRLSPAQAQQVSDELMAQWLAKTDPETAAAWVREEKTARKAAAPQKPAAAKAGATQNEQPNDFSDRDFSTWKREVEREVTYGNQIFHDDKLLGSTNGVSCAMCHPNAANTHPETYPKFQIQLRRVALLRDMINWCIENPSRGKKLDADDPKMRALEAYIMAQRKGVAMEYGKH